MRRPVLALVLALAACSEEKQNTPPDAGLADPEAYFSLQKGRCFEYTSQDTKQLIPDLGVAVEETESKQTAVPTSVIVYRTAGIAMRDFVAIENDAIKLYKREFPGGKQFTFDPPVTLLEGPIKAGATITSQGVATIRDYGTGAILVNPPEQHTFRVDVFDPTDVQLPMGPMVNASRVSVIETPAQGGKEVRTFIPGTGDRAAAEGFVVIDFNFGGEGTSSIIYKLQGIRELGADPSRAVPACGSAN
jgi:hypothetical protein